MSKLKGATKKLTEAKEVLEDIKKGIEEKTPPKDLPINFTIDMIKAMEKRIEDSLKDSKLEMVIMSALGNALIRRCVSNKVGEEHFFKEMKEAWDHYKE